MMDSITTYILIALVGCVICKGVMSKNLADFWSPLTFISFTFIYYYIFPFFDEDVKFFEEYIGDRTKTFHFCTLLFFVSILVGFYIKKSNTNWTSWNQTYNDNYIKSLGLFLFILALICYVPVRGLHFSIGLVGDDVVYSERLGFVNYLIDMIAVFCTSSCLLIASYKNKKNIYVFIVVWITLATFIVAGFRSRIVVLIISCVATFYLYPRPHKLNYIPLAAIAFAAYLGFAVMEQSRSYSRGLNMEVAKSMSFDDMAEGSKENVNVYKFSCLTIETYDRTGKRIYFEPIITAALMPIPRSCFPWKPDGGYLSEAQTFVTGEITGAAFLCYVEAFISFGYFGVALYGLLLGCLAKMFWSNYKNNPTSIGAIIALAIFNGFCYKVISRGYLANMFIEYVFYICLPFWLSKLYLRNQIIK